MEQEQSDKLDFDGLIRFIRAYTARVSQPSFIISQAGRNSQSFPSDAEEVMLSAAER